MLKNPLEFIILQELFYQERPKTVIELGSYTGGCAVWFADVLKCFGIKSRVYSVDIALENINKRALERDDITFIQGDLKNIEDLFPETMLKVSLCTSCSSIIYLELLDSRPSLCHGIA